MPSAERYVSTDAASAALVFCCWALHFSNTSVAPVTPRQRCPATPRGLMLIRSLAVPRGPWPRTCSQSPEKDFPRRENDEKIRRICCARNDSTFRRGLEASGVHQICRPRPGRSHGSSRVHPCLGPTPGGDVRDRRGRSVL